MGQAGLPHFALGIEKKASKRIRVTVSSHQVGVNWVQLNVHIVSSTRLKYIFVMCCHKF